MNFIFLNTIFTSIFELNIFFHILHFIVLQVNLICIIFEYLVDLIFTQLRITRYISN